MGDWEKAGAVLERSESLVRAGWSQGALARDGQGKTTRYDGPAAAAWCIRGARERAKIEARSGDFAGDARVDVITLRLVARAIRRAGGGGPEAVDSYNDAPGRTQAECAAVFADAAAECRERRPAFTHGELVFLR